MIHRAVLNFKEKDVRTDESSPSVFKQESQNRFPCEAPARGRRRRDEKRPRVLALEMDDESERLTELFKIRQTLVHTPPEFRPFRKLVLRTRLQELLLVEQDLRLELALSCYRATAEYTQVQRVDLRRRGRIRQDGML